MDVDYISNKTNLKTATKEVYEAALKSLLGKYPFSKITIKMITEECNSSRQAFYYHFRDKYDLVAWVFSRDAQIQVDKYPAISWFEVIASLFESMKHNSSFYRKVMADKSQNSLVEYMVGFDVETYKTMLTSAGVSVDSNPQLLFDISFHAYACVHMTQRWITGGQKESPEQMATMLLSAMPKDLFNVIPNRGI